MPTIGLTRETSYQDMIRAYEVRVDNKKVAKIRDGERITFGVDPGSHTVFLTIDWCRSNKVRFECEDGDELEFQCGNTSARSGAYLVLLYATILRHKYLWLRQVEQ